MRSDPSITDCLLELVDRSCDEFDGVPVMGLSGPQGSGKTTTLNQLVAKSTKRIVNLSIDDFYLSKAQREEIAKQVSPLYRTRGPAGTHDLGLIRETINRLCSAEPGECTTLIGFDKVLDERRPERQWKIFEGRPDMIILEGWLIGAIAPDDFATSSAINEVEERDVHNAWRKYQKKQLDSEYAELWDSFDCFCHIKGPGFDTVFDWRKQQEASNLGVAESSLSQERVNWLAEFIQHYQRLTNAMAGGLHRPGAIISIDKERRLNHFDKSEL